MLRKLLSDNRIKLSKELVNKFRKLGRWGGGGGGGLDGGVEHLKKLLTAKEVTNPFLMAEN